jgi:DNA mismatch endonuclease (patch repair protein)
MAMIRHCEQQNVLDLHAQACDNSVVDNVSREIRSRMMSSIRAANTKLEQYVRKSLFRLGYRYRCNSADLPGRPDIKLRKCKAVLLVYGCYWHGHLCRYFRVPTSNADFWQTKISKNRQRDLGDVGALLAGGWRICIIWECAVRLDEKTGNKKVLVGILEGWL